jgi:hypothetical protein
VVYSLPYTPAIPITTGNNDLALRGFSITYCLRGYQYRIELTSSSIRKEKEGEVLPPVCSEIKYRRVGYYPDTTEVVPREAHLSGISYYTAHNTVFKFSPLDKWGEGT